jgi:DNA-binding response OmpR family regulator
LRLQFGATTGRRDDRVLRKPFAVRELNTAVSELLANADGWQRCTGSSA